MQKHQNTVFRMNIFCGKAKKGLTTDCQSFFYRYLFRLYYYLFSAIICSKSPSILIL